MRSDYFAAHRKEIRDFVHGLLLAEQELKGIFQNKQSRVDDYKKTVTAAAKILLDSSEAVGDVEGLYSDCKYVGFPGNVKWFTDEKWPTNFANLTHEMQSVLIAGGMLKKKYPLEWARWNYKDLSAGLTNIEAVEIPKFQTEELSKVVEKKRAMGTLREGELFSFEIYFQPNQNTFPPEIYTDAFNKVVDLASTYGGSVIVVEGHSDPLGYLKKKRESGSSEVILKRIERPPEPQSYPRIGGQGRCHGIRQESRRKPGPQSIHHSGIWDHPAQDRDLWVRTMPSENKRRVVVQYAGGLPYHPGRS